MKNSFVYIANEEWLDSTALANPLVFEDHKLKSYYPDLYKADYDLRLLVTKSPTVAEKASPIYNNYKEKYGSGNIEVLKEKATEKKAKNVFLNGFDQQHFDYIAPFIKEHTELLYLFKCNSVKDLSALSEFKKLKGVFIFWNNTLEKLWDMKDNMDLKVISFISVTKIRDIGSIKESSVEYITFDSADNSGNRKPLSINNIDALKELSTLKHLKLVYTDCMIDH